MYGSLGGCSLGSWSGAIVRDRGTVPTITKPSSATAPATAPISSSKLPLLLAAVGIAGIIYYVKFRKK